MAAKVLKHPSSHREPNMRLHEVRARRLARWRREIIRKLNEAIRASDMPLEDVAPIITSLDIDCQALLNGDTFAGWMETARHFERLAEQARERAIGGPTHDRHPLPRL